MVNWGCLSALKSAENSSYNSLIFRLFLSQSHSLSVLNFEEITAASVPKRIVGQTDIGEEFDGDLAVFFAAEDNFDQLWVSGDFYSLKLSLWSLYILCDQL